ncbi:MAG: VOC family protein [Solobacterium sp.]|nr:VOC family protein [Solobacterium sp.]
MKMDQVTIRTRRFEEEIQFYHNIVGLTIERRIDRGDLHIVFLSNQPGETCIEVIQNHDADHTGNPFLTIGFHTEDAEKLRDHLIDLGYEASAMESPAPVVKFFFIKDPAGVSVQFVEGGR